MSFDVMQILLYLAVILLATKGFGLAAKRIGLPQVVGMVIAGLLIGPAIFSNFDSIPFDGIINPNEVEMDVLRSFAQVGVVLILFSSGLETDTKELKKSGFAATMIALAGVLVPIGLGVLVTALFMGGLGSLADHKNLMNALFVGCILAATSVGITVETLRELGKLKTRVGTTILSAAIIDDVIGIAALSIVSSLGGDGSIGMTLLKLAGFFVLAIAVGFPVNRSFKWLCKNYPHRRRTGIFSLVVCFFYAYVAEKYFGIAAITGAFLAGVILSGVKDSDFVDKKIVTSGYMIFSPIFFAFIGLSADFSSFRPSDLLFGLAFVAVGIIGKIVGCGCVSRLCRYDSHESVSIGCGMIARGEVALAVYTTGHNLINYSQDGTLVGVNPLVATIMLIVISSVLCPVLLKLVFSKRTHHTASHETKLHDISVEHKEGGN